MQMGRCHHELGPTFVSVISKSAYPVFMACSEMLNHAENMSYSLRRCAEQAGWGMGDRRGHAPDSVVANVPEPASSAQNMTVTTMAAFISFQQHHGG